MGAAEPGTLEADHVVASSNVDALVEERHVRIAVAERAPERGHGRMPRGDGVRAPVADGSRKDDRPAKAVDTGCHCIADSFFHVFFLCFRAPIAHKKPLS